jgi:hypothetical protein
MKVDLGPEMGVHEIGIEGMGGIIELAARTLPKEAFLDYCRRYSVRIKLDGGHVLIEDGEFFPLPGENLEVIVDGRKVGEVKNFELTERKLPECVTLPSEKE